MTHLAEIGDYFKEKEICVERIIQHFILSNNSPLSFIITFLARQYYSSQKKLHFESITVNFGSVSA